MAGVLTSEGEKGPAQSERGYPPFWERAVPIVVVIIVFVITALLVVAILVALGVLPGSA
jgi:hypothetical protein